MFSPVRRILQYNCNMNKSTLVSHGGFNHQKVPQVSHQKDTVWLRNSCFAKYLTRYGWNMLHAVVQCDNSKHDCPPSFKYKYPYHYTTSRKVSGSIPDEVTEFFNWPNPSSRIMALGLSQPLIEMSTRNLPGDKGRPARKADNLTAICEPSV
jgi:hypothetical protein